MSLLREGTSISLASSSESSETSDFNGFPTLSTS